MAPWSQRGLCFPCAVVSLHLQAHDRHATAPMRDTRPIPVEIQVASGTFHKGVPLQTVLDAIERQFLYPSEPGTVRPETPAQLKARLAKIAGFVAACQSGSLPPDLFTEFASAQEALRESVDWACSELMRLRAANASLLSASKKALSEMCRTTAPSDSFTEAVDALDSAITSASETTHG